MNEKQQYDSDTIFLQISGGGFDNFQEAETAVILLYVPDMTISREGICDAIRRLRQHYKNI